MVNGNIPKSIHLSTHNSFENRIVLLLNKQLFKYYIII